MTDRYDEEKRREYNRQYKQKNKERIDKLMKDWHQANPDKNKEYKRKYRENNRDLHNTKNREYYHLNIEKERKRSKLYQQNHPEKSSERSKRWKHNNPEKYMYTRSKARAKLKGIEFTITLKDIFIPAVCPIFNLPLFTAKGKMADNSPSLDRINPNKGYVKGNIVVISWKANRIKNNATADELIRLGTFIKSYSYDL